MSFWKNISKSNFAIRLMNWEYWPFGVLHLPVIFYWLWLSVKARSFLFFSASNPGIVMGGMFGESKYEVLKKIPEHWIPKTTLIRLPVSREEVVRQMAAEGFSFPVIFKPDLGERGHMVRKISSSEEIESYLGSIKIDFIVQELVDYPMEFGVFYTRFPHEEFGRVTSVVGKEMLSIEGDGKSTISELILQKDRAKLQWSRLREIFSQRLTEVLPKGETLQLVGIGNHALGTKFLDSTGLINDTLSATFDRISKQIPGFYFGRFDLRVQSLDDLYAGRIKIMELNGCGAEPAHIYQPGFSIFKAVKVLLVHWRNIYRIAIENRTRGVKFISFRDARQYYRKFKAATS